MEEEDVLQKYNFGMHISGQSVFSRNTPKQFGNITIECLNMYNCFAMAVATADVCCQYAFYCYRDIHNNTTTLMSIWLAVSGLQLLDLVILVSVCALKNIKLCTASFAAYTLVFWSYIAVIIDSCSRASAGRYYFNLTLRYKLSSAAFYRGLVVSIN